ncbi:RNase H domain-containing protein [Trichonephila inaurata madagascariensis]|uniref:RNase H domain-containing protein n=1 Tax=Trichonephila inaurata madagascariensis TaxID=2747483 RepID=A0A8X6YP60_9ARAC|nr:RNase H domain-containing protein [Trichonephila inaurata madagascariensis]
MDPFCLIALMQVPEFSTEFFLSTSLRAEVLCLCDGVNELRFTQLCHNSAAMLGKFTRAVNLRDSKTALLAIVSDNNPITQNVLDCRQHLKNLESLRKTIVLQWVPANCGVPGNQKADSMAKKGVLVMQKVSRSVSYSIKILIKRSIKPRAQEHFSNHVSYTILNLRNGPRRRAVAKLRLATGYDCL